MSLVPVPQMTVASSPISSRTARSSSICSSSVSVGHSPVVPATTTPCEPLLDQVAGDGASGVEIDRAALVEGRDHRGDDAGDRAHAGRCYRVAGDASRRRPAGAAPPRAAPARAGRRRDQEVFAPELGGELDSDRQPVGVQCRGSEIAGCAGDVEERGEGALAPGAVKGVHRVGAGIVVGAERHRRLRHRRRQQQVEARLEPARDILERPWCRPTSSR